MNLSKPQRQPRLMLILVLLLLSLSGVQWPGLG